MKIIFFGSDLFSVKALEACLHAPGMEVVLVVTTPAQKKGRGLHLEPTPVFEYCRIKSIPVADYATLRDAKIAMELLVLRPEIFVAASYGKLIPPSLLEIPKYRLNVHPSLLPQYRGSAPIHWSILNGDTETGVSIIDIAEKLDAGDIYCQEKLPIDPRADAVQLTSELARFSYGILKKVLAQAKEGQLHGTPQDESQATLAPQLSKEDGALSLGTMTAQEIDRKVRGLQPWPCAYCFVKKERITILEAGLGEVMTPEKPGTLLSIEKDGSIQIAAKAGVLKILRVKPGGKGVMAAADFVRGRRFNIGMLLG